MSEQHIEYVNGNACNHCVQRILDENKQLRAKMTETEDELRGEKAERERLQGILREHNEDFVNFDTLRSKMASAFDKTKQAISMMAATDADAQQIIARLNDYYPWHGPWEKLKP